LDASDGSDIEEFTEDVPSLSSSQAISEFSQSQSILSRVQNVKQNGSIIGDVIVSDVVEVLESLDLRSKADVDSMDPSLASLKRSRSREPSSKKKYRTVSASPHGGGQHHGLPMVLRDRPT